jgi:hypothetical protein
MIYIYDTYAIFVIDPSILCDVAASFVGSVSPISIVNEMCIVPFMCLA